ncbi:hypothetical protein KKC83_00225 [Patescibacteria group bacterium]|nr:hypothetical protein [Patescibacteria group bacterium]MCG2697591.1 hypothetical protein [Candidatus Parcubacteria bacterium]MBU4015548.1 hypothetical protein [Patescibacteria group bacterium]MBU4025965.1 hypothetical protein [Patescibacteria group bacterium]MBU4073147.1 hypothetical protein [Patescibacteria group bacterium]
MNKSVLIFILIILVMILLFVLSPQKPFDPILHPLAYKEILLEKLSGS